MAYVPIRYTTKKENEFVRSKKEVFFQFLSFFFNFKILCMNNCGTPGFLCKICDRFFCSSEEAHLRHCSSLEHYDRVCRRVAPPRFEPPRVDRFRHEGFRREFIMASLDNLDRLTATEIQDNLTRR